MSKFYYERAWNIMKELDEIDRELAGLAQIRKEQREIREQQRIVKPIDFAGFNYTREKLLASVKTLTYSDEHVRFVEQKLGVTKPGECEALIKAMDTEQFIRFYTKVDEEWKRKYPEKLPERQRRKVSY